MTEVSDAQIKSKCLALERQAVDSLDEYTLNQRVKKSTIEASLRLAEEAIKCDSNLWSSRHNRIVILGVMGEYKKAIGAVDDEFCRSDRDSSVLLLKAPYYERLEMYDEAKALYKALSKYFESRLTKNPEHDELIYRSIYTKFKADGWQAVKGNIDFYKRKYPNKSHLLEMLGTIHP